MPETQKLLGYDPARLRRAAVLAVRQLGPHQYRVRGQAEAYYDVNLDLDTPCTCADAWHHGRGCKHELAARLQDGDQPLRIALGEMLLSMEKANRDLTRRRRKATP